MLLACGGDPFTEAPTSAPDAGGMRDAMQADAPTMLEASAVDARGMHDASAPDTPGDAPPTVDGAQDDAPPDVVDASPPTCFVTLPCDREGTTSPGQAPGELCASFTAGPPGPFAYAVDPACASCAAYTCACVEAHPPNGCGAIVAGSCQETGGIISVTCQ